jgi:RHS repeat-associated protein
VDRGNGSGSAFYVYDASGQRVRKVWEKAAGLTEERIYLGGFEVFRRHGGAIGTNSTTLERVTLHVMDDTQRIALVETRVLDTAGDDRAPRQIIRCQFGNHVGSVSLELDDQAQILSYEEYAPYGSSTFQAVRSQTEVTNRYRYSGKERDEESGLYYHGARYYAPALGRWTQCDPIGLAEGASLYVYVRCQPLRFSDESGTQAVEGPFSPERLQAAAQVLNEDTRQDVRAAVGLEPPLRRRRGLVPRYVTSDRARRIGLTALLPRFEAGRRVHDQQGQPASAWASITQWFLLRASERPSLASALTSRVAEYQAFDSSADSSLALAVLAHEARGSHSVQTTGTVNTFHDSGLELVGNILWGSPGPDPSAPLPPRDHRTRYLPHSAFSAFSDTRLGNTEPNEGDQGLFRFMNIPAAYHLTAAFVVLRSGRETLIRQLTEGGAGNGMSREDVERMLNDMMGTQEGRLAVRAWTWLGARPGTLRELLNQAGRNREGLVSILNPETRAQWGSLDSTTNAVTKAALAEEFDIALSQTTGISP